MFKYLILLVILLSGCAIGKDGLKPGFEGCTNLHIGEGQMGITGMFNASGKDISWHKITQDCKDIPYHQGKE